MKLAIDWGTSYTKIGHLKEGTLINLAGPHSAIPTAAAYNPASGICFGTNALRLQDSISIQQFKLELKRNPEFCLGPFNMKKLLEEYFSYLNQKYILPTDELIESVTVGVPNYFGLNARRLLLDVLSRCFNTTQVELLPEPVAAAIGYNLDPLNPLRGEVLSLDIGGGTCDFSFLSIDGVDYAVESQLQTGYDAFSGNEIDRAIVYNILWPEFVMQTGYLPTHFPLSGTMSPRQAFQYNRMLQAARRLKLELGHQKEVYINLPDFYDSQSLQMLIKRDTFFARTKSVFDSLASFIDSTVKERAQRLGLMYDNKWDIDGILLVGGASFTPGVYELLAKSFPHIPLTLPEDREFHVLKGLAAWADNRDRSCSVKTVYPFTFYIERFNGGQTGVLEKIPFDLQNLKLELNEKYQVLTLDRDTPFNLSPNPECFNIRIYEGDAETANLSDRFSGRDLVLEVDAPRSTLPEQMAVYLDLSRATLELEDANQITINAATQETSDSLNHKQAAWYHQLEQARPNPVLMQDYKNYLDSLSQSGPQHFSGHDKSTLYKLYALIDIFQKTK